MPGEMRLDPHAKALLDLLVAANRPKTWQLSPPEAREGIIRLAEIADIKDLPVGRIENGTLPGPAGLLPYRSYTPKGARAGPLPVLVYLHGGGFVIGNLDTHEGLCRMLANASGCRAISIDYRLAPEHKFPAAVEDCYAATKHISEHAADFGIDPKRLAIGGDSAGGNLAAVVCQLAKTAGGPPIALQVLLYPRTDAAADTPSLRDFAEGYLLERKSMEWFGEHYGRGDNLDTRISPLHAPDLTGLPPAHIHTAAFDPLRDEGKQYADRLRAAGVPVEYVCHPGMIHHFFALGGAIPYAKQAVAELGAAMRRALG